MTARPLVGGLLGHWLCRGVCAACGRAAAGSTGFAVPGRLAAADRGWRLACLSASPGGTLVRDDLSAVAKPASGRPSSRRLLRVAGSRRHSSLWVTSGLGKGLARRTGAQRAAYEHRPDRSKKCVFHGDGVSAKPTRPRRTGRSLRVGETAQGSNTDCSCCNFLHRGCAADCRAISGLA
jgi:hypothetical protein